MTTTTLDFTRVAAVVSEALREDFGPNVCILAARVTGIVLRELGVTGVEAMACELWASSPAYVRMRETTVNLGRDLTEAETDTWMRRGAWSVQCRFGEPHPGQRNHRGKGYNGHVVTLVDRQWMLDPTLAQVNRPAKQLVVEPPFAWPIDYALASADGMALEARNGTVVIHRLIPGRKDFTRAPDWRLVGRSAEAVHQILRRLEA